MDAGWAASGAGAGAGVGSAVVAGAVVATGVDAASEPVLLASEESLSAGGAARRFAARESTMVTDSREPSSVKFEGV